MNTPTTGQLYNLNKLLYVCTNSDNYPAVDYNYAYWHTSIVRIATNHRIGGLVMDCNWPKLLNELEGIAAVDKVFGKGFHKELYFTNRPTSWTMAVDVLRDYINKVGNKVEPTVPALFPFVKRKQLLNNVNSLYCRAVEEVNGYLKDAKRTVVSITLNCLNDAMDHEKISVICQMVTALKQAGYTDCSYIHDEITNKHFLYINLNSGSNYDN